LSTGKRADLRSIAQVHGLLLNAGTYCRWGRCQFFLVQNLLRQAIHRRYHQTHWYERRTGHLQAVRRSLPRKLAKRAEALVSRKIAESIWRYRAKIVIPDEVIYLFLMIHAYLLSDTP
jgi:hypothetical protein